MKGQLFRRVTAMILTLCMLLGMVPAGYATDTSESEKIVFEENQTVQTETSSNVEEGDVFVDDVVSEPLGASDDLIIEQTLDSGETDSVIAGALYSSDTPYTLLELEEGQSYALIDLFNKLEVTSFNPYVDWQVYPDGGEDGFSLNPRTSYQFSEGIYKIVYSDPFSTELSSVYVKIILVEPPVELTISFSGVPSGTTPTIIIDGVQCGASESIEVDVEKVYSLKLARLDGVYPIVKYYYEDSSGNSKEEMIDFSLDSENPDYYSASFQMPENSAGQLVVTYTSVSTTYFVSSEVYGTASFGSSTDTALELPAGETIKLIATPNDNCVLYGWRIENVSSGTYEVVKVSDDLSSRTDISLDGNTLYTTTTSNSMKYTALFENHTEGAEDTFIFKVGSQDYFLASEAGEAVAFAAQDKTDDIVVVIGSGTITNSFTIPSGVTLLVPYASDALTISEEAGTIHANRGADANPLSKTLSLPGTGYTYQVEVVTGTTITLAAGSDGAVGGRLVVGGVISGGGSGSPFVGQTSGAFSEIILNGDIIVEKDAVLSSSGYIYGDGTIIANGGHIYQPFVFNDFSGGTYMAVAYNNKNAPFNCYSLINIQSNMVIQSGGSLIGYADIYANDTNFRATVPIIGKTGAVVNTDGYASVVNLTYEPTNKAGTVFGVRDNVGRNIFHLSGGASMGALNINLGTFGTIESQTITFPVSYNWKLIFDDGIYEIQYGYKLNPGAELHIEDDATLNLRAGSSLSVYNGAEFRTYGGGDVPDATQLKAYGYSQRGRLIVNGTINIEANATLTGIVESTKTGGTIIIADDVILTKTIIEGVVKGEKYLAFDADHTNKISTTLVAQALDVASGELFDLSDNTTYKSVAGIQKELDTFAYSIYDDNGNATPAAGDKVKYIDETAEGGWGTEQTLNLYYNGNLIATVTAYVGESLTDKVPTTYNSKKIIEWVDDSGQVYGLSTMPAGVTKLNAVLGINKTVTFHSNNDTATSQTQTYDREYGALPELYEGWTKTGYVFNGWNTAEDGTGSSYVAGANVNVSSLTDLYAQWTPITYTVKFDGNGADGGSMVNATWTYDQAYTPTNRFTKTGYTFAGWKDAAGNTYGTSASISNLASTQNTVVTLTAQWTPITYRVKFTNGGGTGNDAYQTLTYDQEATLNANSFTKTGHSFAGWKLNDTTTFADRETVSNLASTQDAVVTLTAQWTINQYTMTFDSNGGEAVENITQDYGTAVTAPTPVKEGYTFDGWKPEVPGTMPAEDTSYTATWTLNSYTITFNTAGGSTVAPITQEYGTAVTAPAAPTKYGYTFAGWSPELPATMPADGLKVTAQWTANSYNVLYYAEKGDTTPYATIASTFDAAYTLPTEPVKTGYTFTGWVDADGNAMPDKLTSDTTESYYATYAPVDVTIQLDANDGTLAGNTLTAKYDSNYFSKLPTPTRTGYIFDGWFYGNIRITEENAVITFTETCTLTAGWTAKQYGISYAMDGGTFVDENAVRRTYTIESDAYTIPVPEKEGYTFLGWTGSNGTNPQKEVTIEAGTTGDLSYTANWAIQQYTIKFVDTDGTTVFHEKKYNYDDTVATPENPTKEGYTFKGWKEEIPSTMPAKDVTITATWTVIEYTITFDSNGGTKIDSITQDYGTEVTVPTAPTKTGYTFTGWSPALPSTMPAENVTHTAQWAINQYTITFKDTGNVAYQPIIQDYNTDIEKVADPVRDGYTFLGWDVDIPSTMPATNTTITAQWAENATVTLDWGYDNKSTEEKTYVGAEYAVNATVSDRDGYTFDGWFTIAGVQVSAEAPLTITGDITLYAQWEEISNKITYDLDGGTLPDDAPTGYSGAKDVVLVAPKKTGYTFVGWTGSNDDTPQTEVTIPKGSTGDKTYTAHWIINTHTVTWDVDGETTKVKYQYGKTIVVPDAPEKEGYTFTGWSGYTAGMTMPDNDLTFTAQWNINKHTVTWNVDGVKTPFDYEYGDAITLPTTPTKTGYTFASWSGYTADMTMPDQNVEFTATWTPNTYNLNFNLNYKTDSTVASITQTYDKAYILAADPTREGYTFGGWYTTVDCQEGTKVTTSDLYQVDGAQTLYAKWTVVSYTITFDSDGGSAVDAITADFGTAIEKPANPTKTGYTFAGWDAEIPSTMPAGDMTIKATWTVNQYTITFDTDGGSVVSPITQNYGTDVKAPAGPIKTGYTFAGWDAEIPGTMPAGDMTIKATWTVNRYTITFDTDGGSSVESITADFGTAIEKPADPSKTGYTFKGWDVEFPETMPAGNRTLKAVWEVNQYTITFDTDGGSAIAAITQDYGTAVTAPENPTKTGHAFKNWDKEIPSTMPAEDMTITASWDKESYVLTLNVDGEETKTSVLYEAPLTGLADKPGKTGHKFRGWYSQPEGGKLYTTASTMPAGPLTLYAQWDKATYTITYMYGETVVDTQTWLFEEAVTASGAKPTREGYTFVKWAGVPDTMPATDLTVYPEWDANEYTIRFENTGNTIVNSITADYDTIIAAPAEPSKTGYTFAGWEPAIPEKMPLGGLTVTAKWTAIPYTITFNSNGGSSVESATYYYMDEIAKPEVPVFEGHKFICWHKNADLSDGDFFAGTVKMPAESFTLYAEWDTETYTITLDPGEGGTVSVTSIPGRYHSDQDVSGYVPVRKGYLFQGWYHEDTQYTTFKMPAGGIVLTAKYVSYLDLLYNLAVSDIEANEETLLLARDYYSKLNEEQKTAYDQNEYYQAHRKAFFEAIRVYSVENLEQSIIEAVEPTNEILENHGIEGIDGPIAELELHGYSLEGILMEEDCLAMNLLGVNFLEELFAYGEIVEIQVGDTIVTNISQLDIMLAVAYETLGRPAGQTYDEFLAYLMDDTVQYSMTVGDMDQSSADAIVTGETSEGVRYSLEYSFLFFNETHTVRWNDGSTVTDQLCDYKQEIYFNDTITKTGHTLTAWKDASGNEVAFPVTMGKTDVEYFAVWTPNEYNVILNYGDGRENGTAKVTYGGYYYDYLPKTVEREGYTFKGWYSEPDGQGTYYDAEVKVDTTETITVYAFWGANEFSISFDSDGGTPVTTIYQQCDATVTAPADPTKAGYVFEGWYLGGEKYTFTTMPAENITLTAKWTPATFTITFMDDDGVTTLHTITAKYGEAITPPEDPTKIGYTFQGWDKTIPATMPVDGMTIKAQWEINRHTITFDTKGGTSVAAVTLSYGTEIPLPDDPTKTGYTFLRWEPAIPETMPDKDMTITAIWQVNSYKITFDSDGGSEVDPMTVNYGGTVEAPAVPTRTGYTFVAWEPALPTTMPANDLVVIAQWEADTYEVTLDFADGVSEKETITVTFGQTYVSLPTPTREGYDFVGWFDGEIQINTTTVVPVLTGQTLKAKWNESGDTPYQVEHYQQGLDGKYTLVDTTKHTGVTGGTAQVSHLSYTGFHANNTLSDITGEIKADGSLVLKVYYDRNLYNITWKVRGTTVTESWAYGATPVYTDTAWEDDIHYSYTFIGWDQEIKAVDGDATYTAQYDKSYEASIGTVTYKTLKLALENAVSGNVVRLDADVTLTEDLTVPADVTLLIPCMEDDAGYNIRDNGRMLFNHDGTSTAGKTGVGPYAKLYKSLTVPEGITLTVSGTMLINSVSGRPATSGYDNDITGGYGQVNLDGNITVENGGKLDCFGYVKGEGLVTAKNGAAVGDLYIVRHWRGGTQGLDMYQQDIYPINEYDCHNIQTDLRVDYGASLEGLVKMFANAGSGGAYYYTRFPQIHNTNGLLRLTTEDSYVIRKYVDGVEKFYVYGGANFGSSALSLLGMSLSTAMMVYPTDGDITYDLYDGEYHFTYTENNGEWANGFKFLTGSSLTVHDGASLTVDQGVTLSFYEEFVDGTTDATKYPDRPAAVLYVKAGGKFINAGSFGGMIETESPDILIGDYPDWGTVTYESAAFSGSTDTLQTLTHDLAIYREGYSWKYGNDLSIIWIGADYTEVEAALKTVPADLFGYSRETRDALEAAVEAVIYGLPTTRQSDVDAMAKAISDAVQNLKLAVIKVSFDANGGSAVSTTMTRTFGDAYGTLPETSLEGYEFVGWYTEVTGGQLITAETKVNFDADITLYAKWRDAAITEPADYTALNAAVASVPTDVAGFTDASVAAMLDAVNKVEYGLTIDRQNDVDAWTTAIYAAIQGLTPKTLTITFAPGEGRASFLSKTVTYQSAFGELPTAVREHYAFVGWFTAEEGGTQITADSIMQGTEDMTLYAHYVQVDGDYTLVNRYLTLIEEAGDLGIYSDESIANINAAVADVVTGLGAEDQDQIDQMAQALRKAWNAKQLRKVYVTFKPNGGDCNTVKKQIRYGDPYSNLPVATREGYTFLGWFTDENGGTLVDGNVIMNQVVDHNLYAHWKWNGADYTKVDAALDRVPTDLTPYTAETKRALQDAINAVQYELSSEYQSQVDEWAEAINKAVNGLVKKTLTVTFEPNGGNVTPTTKSVSYGSTVAMPVPTRNGYKFTGWYTAKSGGTQYTDSTVITANVTLYAHWTMVPADYTVVKKAISEIPDLSLYTEKTAAAVKAAENAVNWNLSSADQSKVNGYAAAIRNAIAGLVRTVPFVDVKENDWFHDDISTLYYAGLIKGMTDTTYEPNGATTRAQMLVLLHRYNGEPKSSGKNPFTDVSKTSYYYDAVCWGYENGIIKGLSDTIFAPDVEITREQFATMLYRLHGEPKVSGSLDSYPDGATVSSWAKAAMTWVVEVGIVHGDDTGKLNPTNTATRAEAAIMLLRYMKLVK